jgi:hypothetical protein
MRPATLDALKNGTATRIEDQYFRTTPRFETAHPKYSFLNRLLTVSTGNRRPEGPIYTIFEIR